MTTPHTCYEKHIKGENIKKDIHVFNLFMI